MRHRSSGSRAGELLEYLAEHKRTLGFTPTLADVADHFRMSVRWVHDGLTQLAADGLIAKGSKRGIITITQSGWDALRSRMSVSP